jgi:hypothetical protein
MLGRWQASSYPHTPKLCPQLLGTTTLGTDKQCGVSAIAGFLAERAAEQFACFRWWSDFSW